MSYLGTFSDVLLALVAFKFIEPWVDTARDKTTGWDKVDSAQGN